MEYANASHQKREKMMSITKQIQQVTVYCFSDHYKAIPGIMGVVESGDKCTEETSADIVKACPEFKTVEEAVRWADSYRHHPRFKG